MVEGWGDGIIVLESMRIRHPHENGRAAFFGFFHPDTCFQKTAFSGTAFSGSMWIVGQNDAIHTFSQKSIFVRMASQYK